MITIVLIAAITVVAVLHAAWSHLERAATSVHRCRQDPVVLLLVFLRSHLTKLNGRPAASRSAAKYHSKHFFQSGNAFMATFRALRTLKLAVGSYAARTLSDKSHADIQIARTRTSGLFSTKCTLAVGSNAQTTTVKVQFRGTFLAGLRSRLNSPRGLTTKLSALEVQFRHNVALKVARTVLTLEASGTPVSLLSSVPRCGTFRRRHPRRPCRYKRIDKSRWPSSLHNQFQLLHILSRSSAPSSCQTPSQRSRQPSPSSSMRRLRRS